MIYEKILHDLQSVMKSALPFDQKRIYVKPLIAKSLEFIYCRY